MKLIPIPQPEVQAMAFQIYRCADPLCGPHVVLFDAEDAVICQFIMSRRNFECFVAEMRTAYPELHS